MPIVMHRSASLNDDRKRHIYIIARLLHSSAAKSSTMQHLQSTTVVSKKVLRLAAKMEQQLYDTTYGRSLSEDAIKYHLKYLAGRACSARLPPPPPSRVFQF
ncbi:hypothetical protein SPRG_11178 [Saprolegnia parasitica CBS 223.65]|uniref:Uncharacterized protein n=1 Tax=Saprolegnia parasitica (strain CBS 223.65) TaxID=695850 RepID=A0A067BYC2_SAPPC|nr:hypothetical protein SPRG_11178 [Saprolegnia parasitica CBS 223.65]KDO23248.1 hypothetical protein SPRG_11178 [Saprolegnia parasitica CBS 223.65]|eukprot:XP_012206037.1 hypothetical protein SPRG_11178 [Saprolegnia parasitica CBS 223.65]